LNARSRRTALLCGLNVMSVRMGGLRSRGCRLAFRRSIHQCNVEGGLSTDRYALRVVDDIAYLAFLGGYSTVLIGVKDWRKMYRRTKTGVNDATMPSKTRSHIFEPQSFPHLIFRPGRFSAFPLPDASFVTSLLVRELRPCVKRSYSS
jgi:hypothetical protein